MLTRILLLSLTASPMAIVEPSLPFTATIQSPSHVLVNHQASHQLRDPLKAFFFPMAVAELELSVLLSLLALLYEYVYPAGSAGFGAFLRVRVFCCCSR
mmetsp:Transcript_91332/g.158001  ORF Transcript_91332/g.158001 Transcript_91332/m.158001 type:complete len:99 (+) Transcript_91332:215-511(+)